MFCERRMQCSFCTATRKCFDDNWMMQVFTASFYLSPHRRYHFAGNIYVLKPLTAAAAAACFACFDKAIF
uniref:Uncharacterized protein n=1 Tax=Syphacia muris TaxID=451379 RepID=A0A0N5A9M6_9BILA